MFIQGPDFSLRDKWLFEIIKVEITRVDCSFFLFICRWTYREERDYKKVISKDTKKNGLKLPLLMLLRKYGGTRGLLKEEVSCHSI